MLAGLSWKECDLGTDPEVGEWTEVVGWGESQIYSGAWFVVNGGMSVYVCLWEGAESGEIGQGSDCAGPIPFLSQGEKFELYPECGGECTQGRKGKGAREGRTEAQERRK